MQSYRILRVSFKTINKLIHKHFKIVINSNTFLLSFLGMAAEQRKITRERIETIAMLKEEKDQLKSNSSAK